MRDRYVEGATPTYRIELYWSTTRKTWHLRLVDHKGSPLGGLRTEASCSVDRQDALSLLRLLRTDLEMRLPF